MELKDVQFNAIDGITSAIDSAIKMNFESLTEIVEADPTQLTSIKGISLQKAADIKQHAKAQLEKSRGSSTRVISRADASIAEDRELIVVATQIDKLTVRRTRRVITPAVCRECGFDLIEKNHLEPWDKLDEVTRGRIAKDMKIHMTEQHSVAEQRIVRESQLIEAQRVLSPQA